MVPFSSILLSKAHLLHPSYMNCKSDKIKIESKDLKKIKIASIVVGFLTLGVGGVALYYTWTAYRKFKILTNSPTAITEKTNGVSKLIQPQPPVQKKDPIQQNKTEIKSSLIQELEKMAGYLPEAAALSHEQLHANLMEAPVGSYCLFPLEHQENKLLGKILIKNKNDTILPYKFWLSEEGVYSSYPRGRNEFFPIEKYDTIAKFFSKEVISCKFPLKELDPKKKTKIESASLFIEDLKRQIPSDKIIQQERGDETIFKLLKNKQEGDYFVCTLPEKDKEGRPQPNLYRLGIANILTYFWICSKGVVYHSSVGDESGEEALLNRPDLKCFATFEEFLAVQKARNLL